MRPYNSTSSRFWMIARTDAQKSTKEVVFMPDPVEQGLAPIIMSVRSTKIDACANMLKSTTLNPALRMEIERNSALIQLAIFESPAKA